MKDKLAKLSKQNAPHWAPWHGTVVGTVKVYPSLASVQAKSFRGSSVSKHICLDNCCAPTTHASRADLFFPCSSKCSCMFTQNLHLTMDIGWRAES